MRMDLTNQKFGSLTALNLDSIKLRQSFWLCRCACGREVVRAMGGLRNGRTTHCGCLLHSNLSITHVKHGHCVNTTIGEQVSPTYASWKNMWNRCTNPNDNKFMDYGGRGITVDPLWATFEQFLEDMGEKPNKLTLERRDNESGYNKHNCRWATYTEQNFNKRRKK